MRNEFPSMFAIVWRTQCGARARRCLDEAERCGLLSITTMIAKVMVDIFDVKDKNCSAVLSFIHYDTCAKAISCLVINLLKVLLRKPSSFLLQCQQLKHSSDREFSQLTIFQNSLDPAKCESQFVHFFRNNATLVLLKHALNVSNSCWTCGND